MCVQVIDFCDSEKLLERFKEGAILLDQVRTKLSHPSHNIPIYPY
jgi:hypothetical protein